MLNTSFQKAVGLIGGQARTAVAIKNWHASKGREVKVSQAHVWNWLNSNSPMPPAEHCRAIEEITNGEITRYNLRPDVFGTSSSCDCDQAEVA
jgi:DNA-binding transcriptional regulator YdaS (Cro superfamily)